MCVYVCVSVCMCAYMSLSVCVHVIVCVFGMSMYMCNCVCMFVYLCVSYKYLLDKQWCTHKCNIIFMHAHINKIVVFIHRPLHF